MGFKKLTRKITWLLPGLSIKRWLLISLAGFVLGITGMALLLNLQPFTALIKTLQSLALIIPSELSGLSLLLIGLVMLYFGASQVYQTFLSATGSAQGSLLEALYRRYKLAQGPNIVAIGGGTGLSTLLRGIKNHTNNISAVVTVGDDGGSSGRLRKEQGIIPPGDIRNCIAALADEEKLITELFQYRFKNGHGLEGHSFGNLFLTAMCRITGDMMSAIKESSKVLNIRGQVLPSTLENIALSVELEDGTLIEGESEIPKAEGKIKRLFSTPQNARPLPEVIKAINSAELIILGPGSLYTSVIPNLLIKEIAEAVARSKAPKVYVANIMTQPGETDDFSVGDHIQAIIEHTHNPRIIDAVFVNNWLPEVLVNRYKEAHCIPVDVDLERCQKTLGVEVVQNLLVNEKEKASIRHNPKRVARAILNWYKENYRHRLHFEGDENIKSEEIVTLEKSERATEDLLKAQAGKDSAGLASSP